MQLTNIFSGPIVGILELCNGNIPPSNHSKQGVKIEFMWPRWFSQQNSPESLSNNGHSLNVQRTYCCEKRKSSSVCASSIHIPSNADTERNETNVSWPILVPLWKGRHTPLVGWLYSHTNCWVVAKIHWSFSFVIHHVETSNMDNKSLQCDRPEPALRDTLTIFCGLRPTTPVLGWLTWSILTTNIFWIPHWKLQQVWNKNLATKAKPWRSGVLPWERVSFLAGVGNTWVVVGGRGVTNTKGLAQLQRTQMTFSWEQQEYRNLFCEKKKGLKSSKSLRTANLLTRLGWSSALAVYHLGERLGQYVLCAGGFLFRTTPIGFFCVHIFEQLKVWCIVHFFHKRLILQKFLLQILT